MVTALIASKRLGLLAVVATVLLVAGGASMTCSAQGSCSEGCRAQFSACYKSTSNRSACESQLQRCLQGCVSK